MMSRNERLASSCIDGLWLVLVWLLMRTRIHGRRALDLRAAAIAWRRLSGAHLYVAIAGTWFPPHPCRGVEVDGQFQELAERRCGLGCCGTPVRHRRQEHRVWLAKTTPSAFDESGPSQPDDRCPARRIARWKAVPRARFDLVTHHAFAARPLYRVGDRSPPSGLHVNASSMRQSGPGDRDDLAGAARRGITR